MPAKVVVRNLRKRYGGTDAAKGVSFDIEDGEIFGLLGRTRGEDNDDRMRHRFAPDEGERSAVRCAPAAVQVKQKIGAALQTTAPRKSRRGGLPVRRVLPTASTPTPCSAIQPVAEIRPFDALGRSAPAAGTRASVRVQPELVFLDEPTSGLDPHRAANCTVRFNEMTATPSLTTHNMEEAASSATGWPSTRAGSSRPGPGELMADRVRDGLTDDGSADRSRHACGRCVWF